MELGGVTSFQRRWFGFGGAHILSRLIQMAFCCFNCLGVVLLYVSFGEHWPAHIVARFDGFEPS